MSVPLPHPQTFSWIQQALDESMGGVMQKLSQVEIENNFEQLKSVPADLHQIHGSLKMVELEAAGMLAEDLEALCEHICIAETSSTLSDGLPILRQGLEVLRRYIDDIAAQIPVSPLTLVEDINKIRNLVGRDSVSSLDLFSPPLGLIPIGDHMQTSISEAIGDKPMVSDEVRASVVVKLHKKYRRALLRWLENIKANSNSAEPLIEIQELLQHLFKISSLDVVQQLWWVATGFVEAVATGHIPADVDIKAQFARLDREIARFEAGSTANIVVEPPDDLLRELLFYIGSINEVNTEEVSDRVRELHQSLALDQWFYPVSGNSPGQGSLGVQQARLKQQFGEYAFEKLEQFLTLHFAEYREIGALKPRVELTQQLEILEQLAGEYEIDELGLLVKEISNTLIIIAQSNESLDRTDADIKIALAILFVRESIVRPSMIDNTWNSSIISHVDEIKALTSQTAAREERAIKVRKIAVVENQRARAAVNAEIGLVLVEIESIFSRAEPGKMPKDDLDLVSRQLYQISNLFMMTEQATAVTLSQEIAMLFDDLKHDQRRLATDDYQDIAFSIAALGNGANHMVNPSPDTEVVLGSALERLSTIGESIEENTMQLNKGVAEVAPEELHDVAVDLEDIASSYLVSMDDAEGLDQLLLNLDQSRRELRVEDSKSFIFLGESFAALGDTASLAGHVVVESLCEYGKLLCSQIEKNESVAEESLVDFLGLLVRQIKDIYTESDVDIEERENSVDLKNWRARFEALLLTSHEDVASMIEHAETSKPKVTLVALEGELKQIFVDEFDKHLNSLSDSLTELSEFGGSSIEGASASDTEKFIQVMDSCVHTLTGNCRNLKFFEVADCAESSLQILFAGGRDSSSSMPLQKGIEHFSQSVVVMREAWQEINDSGLYGEAVRDSLAAQNDEGIALLLQMNGVESVADIQPVQPLTIDEDIRQIFLEEVGDILGRISGQLIRWREGSLSSEVLGGIRREFHTLKGSAATTGYVDISELSHSVETLLEQHLPSEDEDDNAILNLLEEIHDGLAADLGVLSGGGRDHAAALNQMVKSLLSGETQEAKNLLIESLTETDTDDVGVLKGVELDSTEGALLQAQSVADNVSTLLEHSDTDKISEAPFNIEPIDIESDEVEFDFDINDSLEVSADTETIKSVVESVESEDTQATGERERRYSTSAGAMRIDNKKLAELINASGELALVRTQLQSTLDATQMDLEVLRASMSSMRDGLRELELEADAQIRARPEDQMMMSGEEFDPLQLDRYSRLQAKSREVAELLDQLGKVERELGGRTSELHGALQHQLHLGDQLQSGLISARMVTVGDYLPRLRHLVRETGRQVGKRVEFNMDGGDIQVDRQVVDTMMAPFEHMIRNAVVHGIEDDEQRVFAGKSVEGRITISLIQQGSELVVIFSDDGRGLDVNSLAKRAVDLGLVDDAKNVTETHLLQIICQSGYSTARELSMESGRGVGMDVVYQTVRDLGGSMSLSNVVGEGVSFSFRLPVTLAVTQALLIKIGKSRFAIRSRTVERLLRVPADQILNENGVHLVVVDDLKLPLVNMRSKLNLPLDEGEIRNYSIILMRLADRLAAFEVDAFEDTVNIVSKNPGKQLLSIPEISGVTVLADSSVVFVLNPEAFIDQLVPFQNADHSVDEDIAVSQTTRVLVVDDSLIVRKVMQKDVEACGFEVDIAVDGLNALDILKSGVTFDIALVDIEMPRMNGYEFLEKVRSDAHLSDLPIVIITSRSGDQHRKRAIELGASGYITKPYDISALEQLIRDIVANPVAAKEVN